MKPATPVKSSRRSPHAAKRRIGKASRPCRVFDLQRQPDEAVGPDRRRRSEQERVEHAEHGRVGADAQRERQNRGRCPGRVSKQLTAGRTESPGAADRAGNHPQVSSLASRSTGGIAERAPRREIGFLLGSSQAGDSRAPAARYADCSSSFSSRVCRSRRKQKASDDATTRPG